MIGGVGLQNNLASWLILAAMCALWAPSIRLIPDFKDRGWRAIFLSVYGLVWVDFGLDIILRFLMLSYNAVEWGNGSLRLVTLTPSTVVATLAYCTLFWVAVSAGYVLGALRRSPGPLVLSESVNLEVAYAIAIPTVVFSSVAFYVTEGETALPLILVTPLVLLANLYMVPATIIWWDHFRRAESKWRISAVHVIVLLPAIVRAARSPYRENLAPILLIPLIAALAAGIKVSLPRLVAVGLVALFVLTVVIGSYRRIKWDNASAGEIATEAKDAGVGEWIAGTWDEPLRRFHGFDSMLLTVALVPSLEAHSGRDVLVSPFIRGLVPRFIYNDKAAADAGIKFGERIWAFDDPDTRARQVGSIAPSMPGDLYDAGGAIYVAAGGLIWGFILGLVDGWKRFLPAFCSAAVVCLLATQCLMSVERDFDHTLATFIQTLLVFTLAAGLVALVRRRKAHGAQGGAPGRRLKQELAMNFSHRQSS